MNSQGDDLILRRHIALDLVEAFAEDVHEVAEHCDDLIERPKSVREKDSQHCFLLNQAHLMSKSFGISLVAVAAQ